MRAIDMLCLLLSPAAAGFLMTFVGMLPAVAAIWLFSAVAWLPECALLRVAHTLAPDLRCERSALPAAAPPPRPGPICKIALSALLLCPAHPNRQAKAVSAAAAPPPRRRIPFAALADGWGVYLQQPTLLPALALALLYLTVLSLGFLMTAFLTFNGLNEARWVGGGAKLPALRCLGG
jgi:iron-regulated transporter 1